MQLFSETIRVGKKDMPTTKEECINLGITHVRVAWDDTHPWINVESLKPGKIRLHTSNVFGKDSWVDEIIGKKISIWEGNVIETDFIDRPTKVRKVKKITTMPNSYSLTQGGFEFV